MGNSIKLCKCVGMLLHGNYLRDVRVRREAEALAAIGIDVHVVCLRETAQPDETHAPHREAVNGVHIHRVPLSRKRGSKLRYFFEFASITFLGLWKLTILHMKKKFDVVHIHNMPDILVVAGLIPKWLGAILLLDVHDPMNELFQANYRVSESGLMIRAIKVQERLCYKLPDHLVTVSHPMAENVAKKSGRPMDSIKVVHNFPDLIKFPVREDMQKWPRNENSFVILYAGTVTEHYGLDIAVRAIAAAAENIKHIRLRILGDGNRIHQVLSLANELDIGDRVEHIKWVEIEFVKDIMAEADVGISTHNGGVFGELYFSNKIIDFMTQGVPVISSRTYTLDRYIPEDAIFYFEPGNIEDLVNKIIEMYSDPVLVQKKIRKAKDLVAQYSWQIERESLISFYKKLLNEKGE